MRQLLYYTGRALQLVGLATISSVVILFFTEADMKPLLTWTLVGISEFYGGTFVLNKVGK